MTEIVKNHVSDVSLRSLWRNLDWNRPVCWSIASGGRNQLLFLQFLGCFFLTTSLQQQKMSMFISLLTLAIRINDTSEFWELFEATMDKCTMR